MAKTLFIGLVSILSLYVLQMMASPSIKQEPYLLGQTLVSIRSEYYGPGKIYVHLHANETTALTAARSIAVSEGGTVITLVHQKTRDVHFNYAGRDYAFDPNRIFTNHGVQLTLLKHASYDAYAEKIVADFGRHILKAIPAGHVVAVHNNRDYSLLDYLPTHSLSFDAKRLYYKQSSNHRNFYLVTRWLDYWRLRACGFNVIQQGSAAQDDGSLSIVMANRQYVNVEAGYNQLHAQIKMLRLA